ncbi:hypothetical protein D1007_47144 [Hordeum vulgare]|nr:hypothetical protein D1007_47144 [Hordeum vulgare]
MLDWASGAAVSIFSGKGKGFFSAVVELLSRQRQSYCEDTTVRLDVELADVDPRELESMKEKAMGNLVERIGESILWGPEQEVSLQCFDNYYGEYVRVEDGESMVAKIDQQEGWAGKQVTFYAELIDLQTHSRIGYVPSKMAAHMEDDEWVSQKKMLALLTEPTVVAEDTRIDADGEEGTHGARKIVVDWNVVELNEKIDFVITLISDIDMAEMFGNQVDDEDKEKDDNSLPADGITGPRNANEDEEELMREVAYDVDDTDDNELVMMVVAMLANGTYLPDYNLMEVQRKREEKAPHLVVEQCWPVKKARLNGFRRKRTKQIMFGDKDMEQTKIVTAKHELIVSVLDDVMSTKSVLHALGQSETIADEATVVLPCEYALTAVLPCLEVVLPSVELQTEEVEQCVPSTQSAEVQTEEVGHGQVQKLRRASGVVGKKTKSISINKLCAV